MNSATPPGQGAPGQLSAQQWDAQVARVMAGAVDGQRHSPEAASRIVAAAYGLRPPGPPPQITGEAFAQGRNEADTTRSFLRKMADRGADEKIAALDRAALPKPVIRNGTWLSAQQFPALTYVVPGFIPEGVVILGGPPKGGKSYLVLSVGLSLASGRAIFGVLEAGPVRPVLYLALEDSDARMQRRCRELGYEQIPATFEYVTNCHRELVIETAAEWLAAHRGERPLVIIDTWGKITTPALRGETTYDRDYRLGTGVAALTAADPGSTVWVNHHLRKQGAEDFIDTISGTYGVTGSADTVAVLMRKRNETVGRLAVTGRDVAEESYLLAGYPRWRLEGGSLAGASAAAAEMAERGRLGERQVAILDAIGARGAITTAEVAEMLGITGDAASTYLGRLARGGKIRSTGRGQWEHPTLPTPSGGSMDEPSVSYVGSVGSVGSRGSSQPTNAYIEQGEGETNTPNGQLRSPDEWRRLARGW
jgi:hypothetical protein